MSADLLREAATQMRGEAVAVRRPYARDEYFKLAVADLLDFAAAYGNQPEPQSPTVKHALAVARAYLGRDA